MPTRIELDRLAAARPMILDRTEEVMDPDEENRLLEEICSSDRLVSATTLTRRPRHRLTLGTVAAAVAVLAIVGTLALAGVHPGPSRPTTSSKLTGRTMRLANFTFKLPRGYAVTADLCVPTPSAPGTTEPPTPGASEAPVVTIPVVGGSSYASAASSDGGCVEAFIGQGYSPSAQSVQVGSYNGFLWSMGGELALYVVLPPSVSDLGLVLLSHGLSAGELEQVAESGLGN